MFDSQKYECEYQVTERTIERRVSEVNQPLFVYLDWQKYISGGNCNSDSVVG